MDPLFSKYWERVAWTFAVILVILFVANVRLW
jgi:hypothetical protein